jgi:hypothetical protein
VPQAHKELKEQ